MQTAMIAAAAPLAGAGALAQTPKKKLGIALCGLGSLSTNQIAPALQKTQHCELKGVVSGDREKAKQWQTKYNIPDRSVYDYDSIEKMADNPDIDIVYVVTPNAMHMDNTLAAAKAGKHVFCEKPLEISVDRCQRMIDACKKAERQLGVAYRCQFEPHHLECMRIAREKELGTIKVIESGFGFRIGEPDQWRLKKALAGGGALMDVGIYVLQATRYLTGEEPILVAATETKTDPKKFAEVDETISWTATFPSGVTAYCSTTYNAFGIGRFRAHTERGWFGLDPAFNYGGLKGSRSDGKPLAFPNVDQFATEIDVFARCILENKPTTVPGEEGLQDVKILTAIYESVRTGRAVKIA
jgi:predicted dehydrogenase